MLKIDEIIKTDPIFVKFLTSSSITNQGKQTLILLFNNLVF